MNKINETTELENRPSDVGDSHNFGRYTHIEIIDGKKYFRKHRNLFWEWLLFDESAPLCETLKCFMPEHFIKATFGLKIQQPLEKNTGLVEAFTHEIPYKNLPYDEANYHNLGLQCAYFAVFGIIDLTLDNLKIVNGGVQVIDAECIFSLTSTLEDSFLLPHKGNQFTANYGLFPFFYKVPNKEMCKQLIVGYIKGILTLELHKEKILQTLSEVMKQFPLAPIRVLLRPTRVYDNYLTEAEEPSEEFIPEEKEQLNRGDIPYFFKFVGKKGIHYYSSSDYQIADVSDSQIQTQLTAVCPELILTSVRLNKILISSGVNSLCKWSALGKNLELEYSEQSCQISIKNERVNINYAGLGPISFGLFL